MKKKIFAFIFARGGSKRLKNKNIKLLNNKPLIYYSINLAKKIKKIDKIFVSTENKKIKKISRSLGAIVIDRPKSLSQDNSNELDAWKHAIKHTRDNYGNFDIFLSLPTTSPLRRKLDVIHCLKKVHGKTQLVVTIYKSTRNPWFNMVRISKSSKINLLLKNKRQFYRFQQFPQVYNLTTVAYAANPNYVIKTNFLLDGIVKTVEVPERYALDIDTKYDFKIAELLMGLKKNDL